MLTCTEHTFSITYAACELKHSWLWTPLLSASWLIGVAGNGTPMATMMASSMAGSSPRAGGAGAWFAPGTLRRSMASPSGLVFLGSGRLVSGFMIKLWSFLRKREMLLLGWCTGECNGDWWLWCNVRAILSWSEPLIGGMWSQWNPSIHVCNCVYPATHI